MDASSLSHFQAKKLAIYALASGDEYWAFGETIKSISQHGLLLWVKLLTTIKRFLSKTFVMYICSIVHPNPEDWELFYKFITNRHYLHPFI